MPCYKEEVTAGGSAPAPGLSRSARVVAFLLGLFWGWLFFGLIDLLVFLQGAEFHESFHLETGWGLLFVFIVAAPLIAVAAAPGRVIPAVFQQVLLAAGAVTIGAALSASSTHFLLAIGLGFTALVVTATSDDMQVGLLLPRQWAWWPGALAVVGAGPWFVYALAAAENARAGLRGGETLGLDHWPVQAALAIGIILVASLAATLPHGWVVPTWCVGVCAVWLGCGSLIYPDLDASLGRPWDAAAVAWGLAFIVVTHMAARRDEAGSPAASGR